MKAPVTAPHVSCILPIPAPKGHAILYAMFSGMPNSGKKAAKTACEQLNPLLKHDTAFCTLFIFLVSFRDLRGKNYAFYFTVGFIHIIFLCVHHFMISNRVEQPFDKLRFTVFVKTFEPD